MDIAQLENVLSMNWEVGQLVNVLSMNWDGPDNLTSLGTSIIQAEKIVRAGSARERSDSGRPARTIFSAWIMLVPYPLGALDNFVNEIRAQNVLIHEL